MACIVLGPIDFSVERDEVSHRTYSVKWRVRGEVTDGPANALQAAGLPVPGSYWGSSGFTGIFTEIDPWATCYWTAKVSRDQAKEGEKGRFWIIEQTFSTKPQKRLCKETEIEDPILEPPGIRIGTVTRSEEATSDRFGNPVVNSAHEQIRGKEVEFDDAEVSVEITQNILSYQQAVVLPLTMLNCVNLYPMWGFEKGTVRLSAAPVDVSYYGQCYKYYKRQLTFMVNAKGHDREILDEGTKVLKGHWDALGQYVLENINGKPPDHNNPAHFIRFVDRQNNPARCILNGKGLPAEVVVGRRNFATGFYYVSIQDDNLNHPLSDSDWWVPLNINPKEYPTVQDFIDPDNMPQWQPDAEFSISRGELMLSGAEPNPGVFVALSDLITDKNLDLTFDPLFKAVATENDPPILRGDYSGTTNYALGDVIKDPLKITTAGINLVQFYPDANLFELGLPLTL